ncbi:MAG TPA: biotin--[acetyl-CoA-carboxylase] ligase, partial [Candidatus Limnocylindrales bacterium]|nr:biotin--[acetyl-CoA-carboxylase] ligase [Candidatus Limnocylindrales bacterium]
MTNPEYLLPELLAPMVRNTIFSGNIHHCVQADSTNSIALRGAALAGQHPDDTPEGAVFVAEEQTAGRGRSAHTWHSERGAGIYCSFLLRPPMTPAEALWLSLIAGVAVQDAVRETSGLAADIRWPNDLLINDKKFAGILTEMTSEGNKVHHAVIGIGVNVNQKSFPDDLNGSATSMSLEGGREYSRKDVAAALIRA